MKSQIKDRLTQLRRIKRQVAAQPTEYVEKSSYLQMIDFNIEVIRDMINLIDAVNSENKKVVEDWFNRFREE